MCDWFHGFLPPLGTQQYSEYSGYSHTYRWSGSHRDTTPRYLVLHVLNWQVQKCVRCCLHLTKPLKMKILYWYCTCIKRDGHVGPVCICSIPGEGFVSRLVEERCCNLELTRVIGSLVFRYFSFFTFKKKKVTILWLTLFFWCPTFSYADINRLSLQN